MIPTLFKRTLPVFAVATCALGGLATAHGASALEGKIVVDGSSTVYPITEAAAAAFRKDYPNVNVTVGVSGTGGGFKRFAIGEIDISDASRPIKDKEFKAAKENGVQFIELPVALDGLSIVVSPQNDWADQLTVEDLRKITLSDAVGVKWSDIREGWPAHEIKVYSPGHDSGTFDYFKEVVLPKDASFRNDMSVSEDDNVLVQGVTGDKYAIGYFGAAYYYENQDKLRAVPIVNPELGQAVAPTPENVTNGSYAPFGRPLFIYISTKSLRRPEVRKFAEFYVEHGNEFATQVGYVGLPEEVRAVVRTHLSERLAGTHFMDADLKKRKGPLAELYVADARVDIQ